jgi:hypothetical protein
MHKVQPAPIEMTRTLTTRDRRRVESRLAAWAKQHSMTAMPKPNLTEARWNDTYDRLWINKECGLPAFFDSLFHEHRPLEEGQHHAVYDTKNPAAHVVLESIKEAIHLTEVH